MARRKPTRRIELTFAAVTETNNDGTLFPCLIGPRYALHSLEKGDALAGEYTEGVKFETAYPKNTEGAIIDYNNASVVLTNALVKVGEGLEVKGAISESEKNGLQFVNAVVGDVVDDKLINGYNLRIGDILHINYQDGDAPLKAQVTDIRPKVSERTGAITGIDSSAIEGASVDISEVGTDSDLTYIIQITSSSDTGVVANVVASQGDAVYGIVNGKAFPYSTAVAVGTKGLTVTLTNTVVFNESDANANVLIVTSPAEVYGAFTNVYVNKDISNIASKISTVDVVSSLYADVALKLEDSYFDASAANISFNDEQVAVTVGEMLLPVVSADVNVIYRELLQDSTNTLIAGSAEGLADFLGEVSPENPLAMMSYCAALAGTTSYYVIATKGNDYKDYVEALNVALRNENVFAPITYSQDKDVIAYMLNRQAFYNDPLVAQHKKLWIADSTERESVLYGEVSSGVSLMCTVQVKGSTGVVSFINGDLFEKAVRVGDKLVLPNCYDTAKQAYVRKEYEITKVVSSTSLEIKNADINVNMPSICTINRVLTNEEMAKQISNKAAAYNNPFINYVWADTPVCDGFGAIGTNYLIVTLAALRAASAPHAPLSDVAIPGWSVASGSTFGDAELDIMNDKGVWVVFEDLYGYTVTRHQLTTDQSGTLGEEDSAVSNACNIVRSLRSMLYKYRGDSNIQERMLAVFGIDLVDALDDISQRQYPPKLGSQLLGYSIKQLEKDPDNGARMLLNLDLDVPEPFLDGDYKFNII